MHAETSQEDRPETKRRRRIKESPQIPHSQRRPLDVPPVAPTFPALDQPRRPPQTRLPNTPHPTSRPRISQPRRRRHLPPHQHQTIPITASVENHKSQERTLTCESRRWLAGEFRSSSDPEPVSRTRLGVSVGSVREDVVGGVLYGIGRGGLGEKCGGGFISGPKVGSDWRERWSAG